MKNNNMTQADVDEAFVKVKALWDEAVEASGEDEVMFLALDSNGFVSSFLVGFQMAKELVEAQGLVMPDLVKGLTITLHAAEGATDV